MEIKKRHFYNNNHYTIDWENKLVVLSPEFHTTLLNNRLWGKMGFKKVGGSSIGNITGANPYGSKFRESINIMRLDMPMFDTKYVDAGVAVEPKLISKMEESLGHKLKTYPGPEYDYDAFKDVKHVGGLPDAISFEKDQLYELKTVGMKNYDKWNTYGIPEHYRQQAALYDYLMFNKTRKPKIVAYFLQESDYANPAALELQQERMKVYATEYTQQEVEGWIQKASSFREMIMKHGVSYHFDEEKDKELLSYLMCENLGQYQDWLRKRGYIE